jgi:acyl-homoserine lactone acylase PvdQ
MERDEIAFAGAARQAEMVRASDVTPSELVDLYLERIARIDPKLNAYRWCSRTMRAPMAKRAEQRLAKGDESAACRWRRGGTRGSRSTAAATASRTSTPPTGTPFYNAPYGEVVQGSSMVLTTHLTKHGPKSQGILTYSQATDPTSPWFANMTKLFSRKKWVKLAFTHRQQKRTRGKMVRLPGARR